MAITLTPAAAERVRRFIERSAGSATALRLAIRPSGCSGYTYVTELTAEIGPGDHVFEDAGVKIVVDADSLPLLDGTRIDFGREGLNEGFRYHNPNVKALCGCGESFAV